MAEKKNTYPMITAPTWWKVRARFHTSLPSAITPGYLHTVLGISEKTARDNEIPTFRKLGLIDSQGAITPLARRWRDDEQYADVCQEIRHTLYPQELRDAVPDPVAHEDAAVRWFMNTAHVGKGAATRMARTYRLLYEAQPEQPRPARVVKKRPALNVAPSTNTASVGRSNGNDTGDEQADATSDSAAIGRSGGRMSRAVPDDVFRLPGASYEELVRIVKAYGHYDSPTDLNDVSHVAALHPTSISRNNGFLVAVGILEGGKQKALSPSGRQLARALDHDMTDEIRECWRDVVASNEFIRKLLSAIRIRNGMETSTLQAHIAYSAGQPKNAKVMTGASTLIEILRIAGAVRESDGKIVTSPVDPVRKVSPWVTPGHDDLSSGGGASPFSLPSRIETVQGGIPVSLQLQITCTADEIDIIAPKIRALLAELARVDRGD